jgi:hypothetical protein
MTIKELNRNKVPIVTINPKLEKYKDKVLFQEKLDDANEFLERTGAPDLINSQNSNSVKITLYHTGKKNEHFRSKKGVLHKKG